MQGWGLSQGGLSSDQLLHGHRNAAIGGAASAAEVGKAHQRGTGSVGGGIRTT